MRPLLFLGPALTLTLGQLAVKVDGRMPLICHVTLTLPLGHHFPLMESRLSLSEVCLNLGVSLGLSLSLSLSLSLCLSMGSPALPSLI